MPTTTAHNPEAKRELRTRCNAYRSERLARLTVRVTGWGGDANRTQSHTERADHTKKARSQQWQLWRLAGSTGRVCF